MYDIILVWDLFECLHCECVRDLGLAFEYIYFDYWLLLGLKLCFFIMIVIVCNKGKWIFYKFINDG